MDTIQMTQPTFVFNSVYKGAIKQGVKETYAKNAAVAAVTKYNNGQFTKAIQLIDESIKEAVKVNKMDRR